MHLAIILMPFILAPVAPWLYRRFGQLCIYCYAIAIASSAWFICQHEPTHSSVESFELFSNPLLSFQLSFLFDGLSKTMLALVYGIGSLILIYAYSYLKGHRSLPSFLVIFLIFMGAMGGLVMSNNLLLMFIFWELTSLSSYLLIGFNHEDEGTRSKALQALLITSCGGLLMMAGFGLIYSITGTFEFHTIAAQAEVIRGHQLYTPILICIFAGALTKSAQFPFHFWLPNAMAAPTPVSAYLHSATMVKAGIFLLARLFPVLAGTILWCDTLAIIGTITMLTGAINGIFQVDLKRILAYSTLSVLGTLVMLLGLAGAPQNFRIGGTLMTTFLIYLTAHALYKACLFMIAGCIDHATGCRDIRQLRGLRKTMPNTFRCALVCALSMAGIPLFLGFIGKELLYLALVETSTIYICAAVFSSILMTVMAFNAGLHPFLGHEEHSTPRHPHKAHTDMLIGPGVLAFLSLAFGLQPQWLNHIVDNAAEAIAPLPHSTQLHLFSKEMFNQAPIYLSLATMAGAIFIYLRRSDVFRLHDAFERISGKISPENIYHFKLRTLVKVAHLQTKLQQTGHLRFYISVIVLITVILIFCSWVSAEMHFQHFNFSGIRIYELGLLTIMAGAALRAITTRSRLTAALSLTVIGFGTTVIFCLFGAPDLAITQIIIETLSTLLMFLVLAKLPPFKIYSSVPVIIRDLIIAGSFGVMMTLFVIKATGGKHFPAISDQLALWSHPKGHGENIVNVILVDFRGLDTLGEITVLAIAGLGVVAVLKLKTAKIRKRFQK